MFWHKLEVALLLPHAMGWVGEFFVHFSWLVFNNALFHLFSLRRMAT